MDADAEGGHFSGYLDGFVGGRHIGHNRCAGQHTVFVGLGDGFIDSFAEAEIVRVYYEALVHNAVSLRATKGQVNEILLRLWASGRRFFHRGKLSGWQKKNDWLGFWQMGSPSKADS